MMAGGYDQNQFIGEDGMPISQEEYQQMLAAQQQEYGAEMDQYGEEMMDHQQYQQQE